MDVTEVDAATTAQVSVSGAESGLGSVLNRTSTAGTLAGSVGSVMAGAQYQEAPTVRYQPLLGAALVAQVSPPVSATSIVNLYDSGWPLGSIFDLTVSRFTPGFDDYLAVLDALLTLDRYGALVLEARAAEPSHRSTKAMGATVDPSPAKEPAELVIHFTPKHLRYRFGVCDGLGRLADEASPGERSSYESRVSTSAKALWSRVLSLLDGAGRDDTLVLSTRTEVDATDNRKRDRAPPLFRTRSALGMLNAMSADDNLVRFATKEDVDAVTDGTAASTLAVMRARKGVCHEAFYRSGDLNAEGGDNRAGERQAFDNRRYTLYGGDRGLTGPQLERERRFGGDRRLILVEVTGTRPPDSFVSVFHRDALYSIQDRDAISKRNLALVAQIATIQAVPPSTAPP